MNNAQNTQNTHTNTNSANYVNQVTQEELKRDVIFAAINGGVFGFLAAPILSGFRFGLFETYGTVFTTCSLGIFFSLLAVFGVLIGNIFTRQIPVLTQLTKFGIVGASNTAIDIGVLNIFFLLVPTASGLTLGGFKLISFILAVLNSYLWNKFWSFRTNNTSSNSNISHEFGRFFAVSAVGAVLNILIFHIFYTLFTTILPNMLPTQSWSTIAGGIAAILILAWNFLGYKFIVFRKN